MAKKVHRKASIIDTALVVIGWVSFIGGSLMNHTNYFLGTLFLMIARVLP
jgi:hypothetical protein